MNLTNDCVPSDFEGRWLRSTKTRLTDNGHLDPPGLLGRLTEPRCYQNIDDANRVRYCSDLSYNNLIKAG